MTPPEFVIPASDVDSATVGGSVRLTGPEGRHATTVRRMGPGEQLTLVDGQGGRLAGIVTAVVDRDTLDVRIDAVEREPAPDPSLVVVQALPKGDRGELAVELLTEIGVDAVVPWSAANCVTRWKAERLERGHRRWQDAATAAAKQARRARFPVVEPLAGTAQVADRLRGAALAIVLHEDADMPISRLVWPTAGEVVLVVGPEGGIAPDELAAFTAAGAVAVRLGPTVLRTSSAGIAAAAALLASTPRWSAPVDGPRVEGWAHE